MSPPDIKSRLERAGRSQTALASFLGISKDSANRLVNGLRQVKAREADLINQFLAEGAQQEGAAFVQVPVFGYAAAGGDERIALADDRIIDRIEVPAGLVRGDIMAIRISGDSMSPRLFSGEIVIVSQGLRPSRGGDCVVEFRDGTALVKQYRGEKDGTVFLYQYNPEEEVRVRSIDVKTIHAIIYRR